MTLKAMAISKAVTMESTLGQVRKILIIYLFYNTFLSLCVTCLPLSFHCKYY